jgi:nitroreductase
VLYQILDDARFAPNGGNRQAWRVIVVRDPATKQRISLLYDLGMREYMAFNRAGLVPFAAVDAHRNDPPPVDLEEARGIPLPMDTSYFATVPVLLVILVDLAGVVAVDSGLDRLSIAVGASVYPLAHNILMAARAAGYGGHLTTVLARQESALRELLGYDLPFALATMIPLGKPVKEITKLRREPVESFTTLERFDGPPFTKPD